MGAPELRSGSTLIPVTRPFVPNRHRMQAYLDRIDESAILTNFGPLHEDLTQRLEEHLNVKNLLLVANGTLAIQIALKTLGAKGKVLTTPFSFIATASSIAWEGLEPVFGDIDPRTCNLDLQTLPKDPQSLGITAILAVHVYGNPCDVGGLQEYATRNQLMLIYDAAHAFGVNLNGQSLLQFGDASALSFHATKIFHTAEGGAIVFRRQADYERAKQLVQFGFDENKNIKEVGINAKLSEYHCAVGLSILDDIESIYQARETQWANYVSLLGRRFDIQSWHPKSKSRGAYAPIFFSSENELLQAVQVLRETGIQARRYFHPSLSDTGIGVSLNGSRNSQFVASRVLCLPIFSRMSDDVSDRVAHLILKRIAIPA